MTKSLNEAAEEFAESYDFYENCELAAKNGFIAGAEWREKSMLDEVSVIEQKEIADIVSRVFAVQNYSKAVCDVVEIFKGLNSTRTFMIEKIKELEAEVATNPSRVKLKHMQIAIRERDDRIRELEAKIERHLKSSKQYGDRL